MVLKILIMLTSCLFYQAGLSCNANESIGKPISYTNQETLSFLVKQSDLIAIIQIREGIDENSIALFEDKPKQVNAEILSIINGIENNKHIKIFDSPKFVPPEVLKASIVIRTGTHLVFLSREGSSYKPTTRFSVLDVFRGRVYPVWNQTLNENGVASGRILDLVISEIEMEIEFSE